MRSGDCGMFLIWSAPGGIQSRQMSASGNIRIGISGWRYKGWRGTFYPPELAQRRELEFAAQRFNSIELNGSFYSLQRPESFQRWYDETPEDFVFSVKGSRFVTHMRRLLEVETPLANFFAQGVASTQGKAGADPVAVPAELQVRSGPRWMLSSTILPRTHKEAARLAGEHDERLDGRSWFRVREDRPLRHAIEIRNESFVCEEFIALLRKHKSALVVADTVEWPLLMDVTADFVYCRLHGSEQLYVSGYDRDAIDAGPGAWCSGPRGGEVEDGKKASAMNGAGGAKPAMCTSTSITTPKCEPPSTPGTCRERCQR